MQNNFFILPKRPGRQGPPGICAHNTV